MSPSSDRAGVLTEHVNSPAGHEAQPYGDLNSYTRRGRRCDRQVRASVSTRSKPRDYSFIERSNSVADQLFLPHN